MAPSCVMTAQIISGLEANFRRAKNGVQDKRSQGVLTLDEGGSQSIHHSQPDAVLSAFCDSRLAPFFVKDNLVVIGGSVDQSETTATAIFRTHP